MFNSHSKDETFNISVACTAALLKFESLSSPENYIVSVYYANYLMTLYFQIQFIRVSCTLHARLGTQKTRRTNSTMKGNGDAMII